MLIDSHAHLNDEKLLSEVASIHAELAENGLTAVINVGYDRKSAEVCVDLAKKYDKFYAAVGIHPHDAKTATAADYDFFAQAVKHSKVVAIGEIGLDFYYDLSPRDVQEKVFLDQLELSHSLKIPVILHLRDAYGKMLSLLKENYRLLEYGFLLHCYSGSAEVAREIVKMGGYFSFGGAVTFKNATDKPDIMRSIPINKILLETDCPYMTPVPYRGKTNQPKYVNLVADKCADILGIEREELESITVKNTKEFFKKLQ